MHRSGTIALQEAVKFVENFTDYYVSEARAKSGKLPPDRHKIGKGQLYYGRNGTRKSTLAITVLTELQYKYANITGLYIRFSEWQRALQDTYGKEDTARIAIAREILLKADSADIVVLDDVGQEYSASKWTESKLNEFLRVRYESARPTIVTTNIDPDSMAGVYGDSFGSFRHDAFSVFPLLGRDTRIDKD
jgi:DNA replication protein DnaC